jgi:hypothetical protein
MRDGWDPFVGKGFARMLNHAQSRVRPRKKPPEAGVPVPAVPPRGPLPKQGGAEAPLTFD